MMVDGWQTTTTTTTTTTIKRKRISTTVIQQVTVCYHHPHALRLLSVVRKYNASLFIDIDWCLHVVLLLDRVVVVVVGSCSKRRCSYAKQL
jgi:hypothetical protein